MLQEEKKFPISMDEALVIANCDDTLKTDYEREARESITYLCFKKTEINLVKIKGNIYWMVQVLDGDISGVDKFGACWDGELGEETRKKLRCLVDVNTGEYIYYPERKWVDFFNKIEEIELDS